MTLLTLERRSYQRRYYMANRLAMLERRKRYYLALKSDSVAYAGFIAKARLYSRKRYGWKRTYKKSDARPLLGGYL